jgi:hypothetical protein
MSKSKPPLPAPLKLQVKDPAAFCRNRRFVKHLSFAEIAPPSVLEGNEATVLPTPGGENDDTLKMMHLPRDDLSRMRQMINIAIDKFALVSLVYTTGNCMLKLSVPDTRNRAGYEPKS